MKNSVGFIILIIICVALGITLVVRNQQSSAQKKHDEATIFYHSNEWQKTQAKLYESQQVSRALEDDLKARKADIDRLTNELTQTSVTLAKTEATLKEEAAKIADLETQNQVLDKQASDLSAAITNLNTQITETQHKLASAEGDKAFLQKELQRLMAEKEELEKKFNDLAIMREQVRKLKEELSIARRIEWIRQGLFASAEQKGAQQLISGLATPQNKDKTNYDLNVEVSTDGTVKVIPPLKKTNAPPVFEPVPPK